MQPETAAALQLDARPQDFDLTSC